MRTKRAKATARVSIEAGSVVISCDAIEDTPSITSKEVMDRVRRIAMPYSKLKLKNVEFDDDIDDSFVELMAPVTVLEIKTASIEPFITRVDDDETGELYEWQTRVVAFTWTRVNFRSIDPCVLMDTFPSLKELTVDTLSAEHAASIVNHRPSLVLRTDRIIMLPRQAIPTAASNAAPINVMTMGTSELAALSSAGFKVTVTTAISFDAGSPPFHATFIAEEFRFNVVRGTVVQPCAYACLDPTVATLAIIGGGVEGVVIKDIAAFPVTVKTLKLSGPRLSATTSALFAAAGSIDRPITLDFMGTGFDASVQVPANVTVLP